MRYQNIRSRPAPDFLVQKYQNVSGFLDEVERRAQQYALAPLDRGRFTSALGTFDTVFEADETAIETAVGLPTPEANKRYRVIIQRLLLWKDLDEVVRIQARMYDRVIADLPRRLVDIEEAGGGRDILDPFIVAFTSRLLHSGAVPELLRTLISHKCLMKLEDLIGHLHGEVLGNAGGGESVPEPQGEADEAGKRNKELWHELYNPYPGADARRGTEEFYQIKNKTGSAKGSDGEKLGRQFLVLKAKYPDSKRFYVSMIGKTLRGHRSMGAFVRTDPEAEVLVGLSAFQQLGRHRDTADIVMDLCMEVFEQSLERNRYDFDEVVTLMTKEWVEKHGADDPIHNLLRDSITPVDPAEQSSRTYGSQGPRRRGRAR
jgi:hypothetical protein